MKELHYYRCRNCKMMMCRSHLAMDSLSIRCVPTCYSRMDYVWSVAVETPEQEALYALGRVWNPHPERLITWTCVRCESEFPYLDAVPRYRTDGKCCAACVKAEAPPPLLTPDQQAARQERKAAARREMDAAMERAIQQADAFAAKGQS